jgi:hypothetical protein
MRTFRISGLTGLLLALGATAAQAQHPQTREGFWINFGFGYGSAHEQCDGCADTTIGGFTGFVRLGGTVNPHLLIGGEIIGFSHEYPADSLGPSANEVLGSITASLYYYPKPAGGLFLKAGLGFSDFDFTVSNGGGSVTGVGAGAIVGIGYDIRVGRNISITPTGDFWIGNVGDLKSGGSLVNTGWKHSVASFGLGVTFH